MSHESSPAFQFYPADLLTDEHWIAMTWEERGVYWHLISLCWIEGSIPADSNTVARMLQIEVVPFLKIWKNIEDCFAKSWKPERLIHKRLERERAKQREHRKLKVKAGLASAAARAKLRSTRVEQPLNTRSTEGATESNPSSPSSSTKKVHTRTGHLMRKEGKTRFARWYAIYPIKKARKDAEKAFLALDPDDALTDRMIAAVESQQRASETALAADMWTERWPNPPAWIRGKRWEDAT